MIAMDFPVATSLISVNDFIVYEEVPKIKVKGWIKSIMTKNIYISTTR